MPEQTRILQALRRAAKRRKQAETARRNAMDELRELCREAQAAGVPITRIASAAELSRQGVYDLIGRRPSPRS
jgi:hypothetical protein